jgi:hypothetical protein
MSRKTIVFKMPSAEAARLGESDAPLAADEPATNRWILAGEADGPAALAALVASSGFSVDLAADRSFAEAVTLSLALPTMLGWFWLSNAISRYRRIFAP